MLTPTENPARPRRHRTRQRERLLELLRETDSHPTAAELFETARPEFPNLSLGTVYRNLEVLVGEGQIEAVPAASGPVRYDGNPVPHHHFVCEHCGAIHDVELPLPSELADQLERKYELHAERARIRFSGLCHACSDRPVPAND
jgi:Fur family peroxide stress response transcriptional regulator